MAPSHHGVFATLVVGRVLAMDSPCPSDSLPEWGCKFEDGNFEICDAIANVGQAAARNTHCDIPTPENGCELKPYGKGLKWLSSKGNTCCNCWMQKASAVCPAGSMPGYECERSNYQDCYVAANTGASAKSNPDCIVPQLGGDNCEMKVDTSNGVYYWQYTGWFSNKKCCNCYKAKGGHSQYYSLGQVSNHNHTKSRRLRAAHMGDEDEASMLQLPLDELAADPEEL